MMKVVFAMFVFVLVIFPGYSQETPAPTPVQPASTVAPPDLVSVFPPGGKPGDTIEVVGDRFGSLENVITLSCLEPGYADYEVSLKRRSGDGLIVFVLPGFMYRKCHYANPPCYERYARIVPGNYALTVKTSYGTSDSLAFSVTEVPSQMTAPDRPTILDYVSYSNSPMIRVSWDESPGADGYNIYRGDASGGPYDPLAYNYGGIFYEDTDLVVDRTYYYVITAFNAAGESPASAEAYATARYVPTTAPTIAPSPAPEPVNPVNLGVGINGEGSVYVSGPGVSKTVAAEQVPASFVFSSGSIVSLNAVAATPYPCGYNCQQPMFLSWEEDVVSTEKYVPDITMDRNKTAVANFMNYAPGPTQDPSVTPFPGLSANPTSVPTPDPTPDPTQTPGPVDPRTLTITIAGNGSISVSPPGMSYYTSNSPIVNVYEYGTEVSVAAVAPTMNPCGYGCAQEYFVGWQGDPLTNGKIVMDSDKFLTAVFGSTTAAPTPPPTVAPNPTPDLSPEPTSPAGLLGDVNGDGMIDIIDALRIVQYYVGIIVLTPEELERADANCDDTVNVLDALLVAQYYVGLRTALC